jgi:hypothetical protein
LPANATGTAFISRTPGKRLTALAIGTATLTTLAEINDVPAPFGGVIVSRGRSRVGVYSSPRAAVGNEGDYGGVRVYTSDIGTTTTIPRRVRVR